MTWTCFLVTPTDRAQARLRRYADGPCPLTNSIHNAETVIGQVDLDDSREIAGFGDDSHPHDDMRWPNVCACGYVFRDDDHWQYNRDRFFADADGRTWTTRDLPPGAMYDAPWFADFWHGDDGRCLMVVLPDKTEWVIDGPATNGAGWTRSGEPPRITARPSIGSPGYHGWLNDGVLSDDLEGRAFCVCETTR